MTLPAPPIPIGVSQAELDEIFSAIYNRADLERRAYIRRVSPAYTLPFVDWKMNNPTATTSARSATGVVKATGGFFAQVQVNWPGSAGVLTLNNATTVGGANAGNQIVSIDPIAMKLQPGDIITLGAGTFTTGLVISAMPTDGNYYISYL